MTRNFFRSSAFMRWSLSPFLVLFIVLMPFLIPGWTMGRALNFIGIEVVCVSFLLGLWLPPRHAILAFRVVALLVFCSFAFYLYDMLFLSGKPLTPTGSRAAASPGNAVLGFCLIGLPCLLFAIFARVSVELVEAPKHENDTAHPATKS